jgi:hypothetical protein
MLRTLRITLQYLLHLLGLLVNRIRISIFNRPYVLVGFVSLRRGGPAFVIPYFAPARHFNLNRTFNFFVQELSDDFKIERFRRFTPERYYPIYFSPPLTTRKIGQVGLLAYRGESERVSFGEPANLRRELAAAEIPKDRAPFFNLGVSLFLEDRTRVDEAIALISEKIDDPVTRRRWIHIERAAQELDIAVSAYREAAVTSQLMAHLDKLLILVWGSRFLAFALLALDVSQLFPFPPSVVQQQSAIILFWQATLASLMGEIVGLYLKWTDDSREAFGITEVAL